MCSKCVKRSWKKKGEAPLHYDPCCRSWEEIEVKNPSTDQQRINCILSWQAQTSHINKKPHEWTKTERSWLGNVNILPCNFRMYITTLTSLDLIQFSSAAYKWARSSYSKLKIPQKLYIRNRTICSSICLNFRKVHTFTGKFIYFFRFIELKRKLDYGHFASRGYFWEAML